MHTTPKTYGELAFYVRKTLKRALPASLLNLYFLFFPVVGGVVLRHPSRKLKVIGVTGTDGKSSTVILIARILSSAGYKTGFFSSVLFSDGLSEEKNRFKMTMPGRFFLQSFLAQLEKNKCDIAVLEVTSEGIKQQRHVGIEFDVVVCTNIKPEHLESHGGFAQYKQAKAAIFKNLTQSRHKDTEKIIVVGGDDAEASTFLQYDADKKITFGFAAHNAVRGQILRSTMTENTLRVTVPGEKEVIISLDAGGPFVLENILAAIAVSTSLGIKMSKVKAALEASSSIPGRFELIATEPFIIVDYAHTVAAVEKILEFIREQWSGKIIHVFGAAGGGRDKWKRPQLAALSEKYTDLSIVTEENSFDEPTQDILAAIVGGFTNKHQVKVIPKRTDAVAYALQQRSDKTVLLFTGKGSETVIAGPHGTKTPYNEKETIWQYLTASQK